MSICKDSETRAELASWTVGDIFHNNAVHADSSRNNTVSFHNAATVTQQQQQHVK